MKKISIYFMVLVIISNITLVKVSAENNLYKKDIYIDNSVLIEGILNSYSMNFTIEDDMKFKNGYFNFDFIVSDLMEYRYSSIVVYLNENPIGTYNLYNIKGIKQKFKINIDSNLVTEGNNKITIKTFHRITPEDCSLDEINVANWININKETFIHLEYEKVEKERLIKNYWSFFVNKYNDNKFQILIEDSVEKFGAEAAVNLVSSLKKISNMDIKNYSITKISELDKNLNNIYVMNYSNLPSEIKNNLKIENNDLDNNVLVKIIESPYRKGNTTLIITSKNGELLSKGALLLGDKEFVKKLGESAVLDEFEYDKGGFKEEYTLQELGYGTNTVYGTGENILNYYVKLPIEKYLTGGSIKLKLVHSNNIDFNKSKLILKVNEKIYGERLLKNTIDGYEEIEFFLGNLDTNYKAVNFQLIVVLGGVEKCISSTDKQLQMTIHNASTINLKLEDRGEFYLDTYKGFFSKNEGKELDLIIPREIKYINLASEIAKGYDYKINIYYGNETSIDEIPGNSLIFGTPENNKYIRDCNKKSKIKYDNEFKNYKLNKDLSLIEGPYPNISAIEIIEDFIREGKTSIVFKGLNYSVLERDIKYLVADEYNNELLGKAVIIDSNNITYSKEISIESNKITERFKEYFVGDKSVVLIIALVTIIVILILASISTSVKRRN